MKAPTKQELREQIEALKAENQRLIDELNSEKQRRWEEKIEEAFSCLLNNLKSHINIENVSKITYEHCDEAGYWFTFFIKGYQEEQTYCVRHADLIED